MVQGMSWYDTLKYLQNLKVLLVFEAYDMADINEQMEVDEVEQQLCVAEQESFPLQIMILFHWACAGDKDLEEAARRAVEDQPETLAQFWSLEHLKHKREQNRRKLSILLALFFSSFTEYSSVTSK